MPEPTGAGAFPAQLSVETLSTTHESYCGAYLRRLKALYKGGAAVLRDPEIMKEVFPRYRDESDQVYANRQKRAFYLPFAASILNFIKAALSAERLEVKEKVADTKDGVGGTADGWWGEFFADVSPVGGKKIDLHDYVREAILDGLICKVSWHRLDLPSSGEYPTLAAQDAAGARNAFAVPIPAECVIDWEEDESGELLFVCVYSTSNRRGAIADKRNKVKHTWRVYDKTGWARYSIDADKGETLKPETMVNLERQGSHTFGRVPIVRFDVGDGLWAMDNIEGAIREYFNKRCALSWAEFQSAFQELYEFLGPEMDGGATVIGENQKDSLRARKQKRGAGYVQERGQDDKAAWIGPSPDSFKTIRESCNDIKTEIYRVLYQMALAVDNSGAALKRSAESKGQDKASATVVFEAIGQLARGFAEDVCDLVARGRGEENLVGQWKAEGMAKFDAISVDAEIDRDVNLETVSIPSPTFQRWRKLNLAKLRMGDEATPELLDAIKSELEENITAESFDVSAMEREPMEIGGDEEDDAKNGGEDKGDGEKKEPGDDPGKE